MVGHIEASPVNLSVIRRQHALIVLDVCQNTMERHNTARLLAGALGSAFLCRASPATLNYQVIRIKLANLLGILRSQEDLYEDLVCAGRSRWSGVHDLNTTGT